MSKTLLISFLVFSSFSLLLSQDNCDGLSLDECITTEGCEWIFSNIDSSGGFCIRNEWNDDGGDWENECRYFQSEDECIASGCLWNDEEGCYDGGNGDNGSLTCLLDWKTCPK